MKRLLSTSILGFAVACGTPAHSSTTESVEDTLSRYCEPLISGSSAAEMTKAAKTAGFKIQQISGNQFLVMDQLVLGLSDAPRVCFVQAPPSMTFAEGIALVDAWAARHPGALEGAATKGPDGAPVKMWAAPQQSKYFLVTEQTGPGGQKVLNFILTPMPAG